MTKPKQAYLTDLTELNTRSVDTPVIHYELRTHLQSFKSDNTKKIRNIDYEMEWAK
jgi:hypothetical protein